MTLQLLYVKVELLPYLLLFYVFSVNLEGCFSIFLVCCEQKYTQIHLTRKLISTNLFLVWRQGPMFFVNIHNVKFACGRCNANWCTCDKTCGHFKARVGEHSGISSLNPNQAKKLPSPPTSFSHVTSTNVGTSSQNFLTFSYNPSARLV